MCLSVCLSGCLSVCLPACLPACLSVCLSVYMSVCMYVCLSVCLYTCLYVCVYMHVSMHIYSNNILYRNRNPSGTYLFDCYVANVLCTSVHFISHLFTMIAQVKAWLSPRQFVSCGGITIPSPQRTKQCGRNPGKMWWNCFSYLTFGWHLGWVVLGRDQAFDLWGRF